MTPMLESIAIITIVILMIAVVIIPFKLQVLNKNQHSIIQGLQSTIAEQKREIQTLELRGNTINNLYNKLTSTSLEGAYKFGERYTNILNERDNLMQELIKLRKSIKHNKHKDVTNKNKSRRQ